MWKVTPLRRGIFVWSITYRKNSTSFLHGMYKKSHGIYMKLFNDVAWKNKNKKFTKIKFSYQEVGKDECGLQFVGRSRQFHVLI